MKELAGFSQTFVLGMNPPQTIVHTLPYLNDLLNAP